MTLPEDTGKKGSGMTKAGMRAILQGIERPQNQPQVCYEMAGRLRGEINGLRAAIHGPVAHRPGKKERERREAYIEGMKFALAIALGIPLECHQESVETFLNAFREERLRGARGDRLTEEAARQSRLLAERDRTLRAAPTQTPTTG